jgi:hypothetical protein
MAKTPKDDKDPLHFDELAKRLAEDDNESASLKTDISPETTEDKTKEPEAPPDDEGAAPED